jgi:DNA-binding transcriptional LysR family regulator
MRKRDRDPSSRDHRSARGPAAAKLDRSAVDLNLLIVFDALMQDRSLTRAGRRLGMSQPATSHALARLRRMLGDELFVRTPEGMQPTQRAIEMAEPVRDALSTMRLALEPEAFEPAQAARSFILVVNNYAARAVVPKLARRVAETAPRIRLDIRPQGMVDVLDHLDKGEIDVVLAALVDGGERFKCVGIMEDDYVAVLDGAHPAAGDATLSLQRVAEFPHIALTSTGDDTSFIDRELKAHGLERRIAIRVPFLSIVLMLVGSDSIVALPRRVATDLARVCPLVVRELPFPTPRIALAMIWHRRLDTLPAHRWLRETIRSCV